MYCPECGRELAAGVGACPSCGNAVVPDPSAVSSSAPFQAAGAAAAAAPARAIRLAPSASASGDSFNELLSRLPRLVKEVFQNPISGLAEGVLSLSRKDALQAALVIIAINAILSTLGVWLALQHSLASPNGSELLAIFFAVLVVAVVIWGCLSLARRTLHGQSGSLEADCLIAAFAQLPVALSCVALGILGIGNLELAMAPFLFAFCYSVLIVFAGCVRISGIPERRAIPVLPLILLAPGVVLHLLAVILG